MRPGVATLALATIAFFAAPPAGAELCAVDDVPAATLLLPWLEVDLDDPGGVTTMFSIVNAASDAHLTRVTVWSDLGVPVLWFNVYLTGWDVQTINLRDVLAGQLPSTGDHSPQGDFSVEVDFPGCAEALPSDPLAPAEVAEVRAALTGEPGPLSGQCAGQPFGDGVARGYVTVDVVERCSATPPGPSYYGPGGELAFDDVLVGDFFVVDPGNDSAWGESLVRLEADPEAFLPGDRTFYQSWTGGTAADAREPLPTVWASRFAVGGGFDGGSDLVVWRDPGQPGERFACADLHDHEWFPLTMRELVFVDEEETVVVPETCVVTCPPELLHLRFVPAQANRVTAGTADLPLPYPFGWLVADLNPSDEPGVFRQSWMGLAATAEGRYSVGFDASPLDRSCAPSSDVGPLDIP